MPRIRTIKPDFWDSPDTTAASLRTRLLYIAMWNWADDYGIGDATPLRVIAFAFPGDDIPASDYPRLLADVSGAFGVVFFKHEGRPYYAVPEWEKHQRTEKKAKPKEGLLEAAQSAIAAGRQRDSERPQKASENPPPSGGTSGAGNRKLEVGKGTEEERTSSDPDGPDPPTADYPQAFEDWWEHYPRKDAKRKALEAWRRARKRATNQELINGAVRYAQDPNRQEQYTKQPATWLNGDCWLSEALPAVVNDTVHRLPASDLAFAQAQALKNNSGRRMEIAP